MIGLDALALLAADREAAILYREGFAGCPEALWGYPVSGRGA